MRAIRLDSPLAHQLLPLQEIAELRDDAGNVIGYFTPSALFRQHAGVAVEHVKNLSSDPDVKNQLEALLRGLH